MTTIRGLALAILSLAPAVAALADDAPAPPPPQHEFIGKGQFGFLESKGNSDAESLNANLDILRYDDAWKNELYFGGLYGKSAGVVSAERWEFRQQTNYNFAPAWFGFGGLHFEHDLFDGFVYQASITTGVGYKVLDTVSDKLTVQAGAGYRRLREETVTPNSNGDGGYDRVRQNAQGDLIGTLGIDGLHAFNKSTALTDKLTAESGNLNTSVNNVLALTVKMSTKLAIALGYTVLYNTKPIPPLKRADEITSVNVQYAF
jgi:putative salt-induced outer membrane protein